jgi:F-type H+-transporting ATPase subunit delta
MIMAQSLVATRYATALFAEAVANNTLETVIDDIRALRSILRDSRDFALFVNSPIIKAEQKANALKAIATEARISPTTTTFLMLLVEKNRADELANIVAAFEALYNEQQGIVPLEVVSAVEMDASQKEALLKSLESRIGKQPHATYTVNPALIGGFTVKIGDTMMDSSITHQLAVLKKRLMEGTLN